MHVTEDIFEVALALGVCCSDCHEDHQNLCTVCGKSTCYKLDPCDCGDAPIHAQEAAPVKDKTAA